MKFLIVDDEFYSVKAVKEKVDWESLSDEPAEVFTAASAAGAREIILRETIDILLCDIEMPRESGIELITWVRKEKLPMEVLILTCHSSFAYAKEAIQLSVSDYCVKPIDFRALEGTLKKLVEKRNLERQAKEKSRYGEYWMENRALLEEEFWRHTLESGWESAGRMRQAAEKIHLELSEAAVYHLVLVQPSRLRMHFTKWDQERVYRSVRSVAKEILEGTMESQRVVQIGLSLIVVTEGRDERWLREKCGELAAVCEELLKLQIFCYVGEAMGCFFLRESCALLKKTAFEKEDGTKRVVFLSEENTEDGAEQETSRGLSRQWLPKTAVQQMKEYMEEHLTDELSREDIAGAVHLHPDYANRIFKKSEGESLMDYLQKKRIQKAAYLCDTTDLTMSEIALRTGFAGSSHFSTAFKRVMGVSPRQYKNKKREV